MMRASGSSALLAAFLIAFTAATAGASMTKDIHKIAPLAANGSVFIEMHNGSASVVAWSQPSVDISARIESAPESMHSEDVQATDVKVSGGGASVSIESDYSAIPERWLWFGLGSGRILPLIHYTIRVPATARVHLKDHNATTTVTGLRGDVTVQSHNGAVRLRDLAGAADIETHNGNIDVEFASFAQMSRFSTHNGDVKVTLPAASRFTLNADAHRQNGVTSDFPAVIRASRPLSALINGGGPELRFTAHNGELTLHKR